MGANGDIFGVTEEQRHKHYADIGKGFAEVLITA
jgi:hypothetical protein